MSEGAHKAVRGSAGQLSVSVQCDYVAYLRQFRNITSLDGEAVVLAEQEFVQILNGLGCAWRAGQHQHPNRQQDKDGRCVGARRQQYDRGHDSEREDLDSGKINLVWMAAQESAHALNG